MSRSLVAAFAAMIFSSFISVTNAAESHQSNLYRFEDFSVPVSAAKKAPLRLTPEMALWEFRTHIREAHEKGVNFGSHFSIAKWGCGTECWQGALIDQNTGEVIALPSSRFDYSFEVGSNLLIINPAWYSVDPSILGSVPATFYYKWTGQAFVLVGQEDWMYPTESLNTSGIVEDVWQAIAYNQTGGSYIAKGFKHPYDAIDVALEQCNALYGDCNTGIMVSNDWTIYLGHCSRAKFSYVSLAVSPDNETMLPDIRLEKLAKDEVATCSPVL